MSITIPSWFQFRTIEENQLERHRVAVAGAQWFGRSLHQGRGVLCGLGPTERRGAGAGRI
jgi:hypothetical protein